MASPTIATLSYDGVTIDLLAGDYTVEDWSFPVLPTTPEYEQHLASGGDHRSFCGERYGFAPVSLAVLVKESATDVEASISALASVWCAGAILTWGDDGDSRYTYLQSVDAVRFTLMDQWARVSLSGTRHYAYSSTVTYAAQTVPCVGTVDFPGTGETAVPGDPDIPALTSVKATYAQAVTRAALGLVADPASGFDPLDDYSGASDPNALGGAESANSPALTATWQAVATAPTIDTAANAFRSAVFARVENTATAHTTVAFRASSATTGSAIAATTIANGDSTPATLDNGQGFEVVYLGECNVPAGSVPNVDTGSGWSGESAQVEQTTDDGTKTLTAVSANFLYWLTAKQTFPAFAGRITAIEYTIDTAPAPEFTELEAQLELYVQGGSTTTTWGIIGIPLTVGTHKVTFDTPVTVRATDTVSFSLVLINELPFTVGFAYGNNRYADGALTTELGSGEDADDDLLFKVYGQTQLGFNSAITLQATDTAAASKVAQVDYLVRIPTDHGAIMWTPAAATTAGQGIYIDNASRIAARNNVYLADADGIGPTVKARCKRWGSVQAWPGVVNRLTSVAATPADAAPGDATFSMQVIGRHAALGSEKPR